MYGWILNSLEAYILTRYGEDVRSQLQFSIASSSSVSACDNVARTTTSSHTCNCSWIVNEVYDDDALYSCIQKLSSITNEGTEKITEDFGRFFLQHARQNGYEELFRCQGSTLKEWLKNIDDIHSHLHFATGKGGTSTFPDFVCEDDPDSNGTSLIFHYKSKRNSAFFVPLVVGIVSEAANVFFGINLSFEVLDKSTAEKHYYHPYADEDVGIGKGTMKFTASWRLSSTDGSKLGSPLEGAVRSRENSSSVHEYSRGTRASLSINTGGDDGKSESGSASFTTATVCPFSKSAASESSSGIAGVVVSEGVPPSSSSSTGAAAAMRRRDHTTTRVGVDTESEYCMSSTMEPSPDKWRSDGGISGNLLKSVFPFHFIIDEKFIIQHVGAKLAHLAPGIGPGEKVDKWFNILAPSGCSWDIRDLRRCKDTTFQFELRPTANPDSDEPIRKKGLKLFGGLYFDEAGPEDQAVFLVQPDVESLDDMCYHSLTWSDFPRHSAQKKLVYLFEHLKSETYNGQRSKVEAINAQLLLDMKRTFVRYVSHEIRTPLNTVSMGLKLIQDLRYREQWTQEEIEKGVAPTDEDLFEMADEVKESCDIAINILNDLLLYEKMEGGLLVLERQKEPAVALVYEAVKMFAIEAREASVEFDVTYDSAAFGTNELDEPTVHLNVDKAKISHVLRNLVSNAIRSSASTDPIVSVIKRSETADDLTIEERPRKVTVHTTVHRTSAVPAVTASTTTDIPPVSVTLDGQQQPSTAAGMQQQHWHVLRIEVADTGSGISQEKQAILFNQALQFDPNKLQADHGSGLGLFISKGIMDLHGGHIGVSSSGEGEGACIFIEIPLESYTEPEKFVRMGTINSASVSDGLITRNASATAHNHNRDSMSSIISHGVLDAWRDTVTKIHTANVSRNSSLGSVAASSSVPSIQAHIFASMYSLKSYEKEKDSILKDAALAISMAAVESRRRSQEHFFGRASRKSSSFLMKSAKNSRRNSSVVSLISSSAHGGKMSSDDIVGSSSLKSSDSSKKALNNSGCMNAAAAAAARESSRSSRVPPIDLSSINPPPKTDNISQQGSFDSATVTPRIGPTIATSLELKNLNILVVDDSVGTRKMIVRCLKIKRFCESPVEAGDGAEALKMVRESMMPDSGMSGCGAPFDAILMDFVMPVMDGPTATKEIRDLGYRGLIIGVTGNVLPEDKAFYISKGADAVLTKPLDVAQLAFALSPLYHACAFTEEDESKDDDLQEQQGDNSSPTAKAAALAPLRNKFWEHSSSFSEKPQSSQQPPTVPNREITAASAPISTHQSFSLSPEHMRRTSESAAAPAFEDFRRFFTGGKSASTSQKRGRLTPRQDKDSPDKISAAADGKSKKSANKGAGEASKKSPRGRNSLQCRPVSPKPSRRSRDSYDSWSRNSEGNNKSMFLGNLVAGAMTGSDPPGLKEAVLGEEKDSLSKGPQQASGSGSGSNQSNNVGGGIVGRVLEIGQGVMRTLSRSGSARNIDAMDDYSSKRTACELLKDVDHHEDDETVLAAKEDMMVMAGGPSRAVLTTVPAEAKPTGFIRRIASYFRNLASIAEPRSHGASPLPVVNINPVAATTTAAAQQGNRLLPRLRVSPVSPAISTPSSGMSASGDTPWFNFESPISRLKGGNSPKARVHPLKTDR